MKRVLTLTAFLLATWAVAGQLPFKVISVNGEIVATNANLILQNGVEVLSNEHFDFKKPNSRAAMINSERGRIVLTEQNASDAFAKAAFAPAISAVSSRSASILSQNDVKNFFSNNLLIIDKFEVDILPELYTQDENCFFFVRYPYKGEVINKRLPFLGNKLYFNKSDIFTVDGDAIDDQGIGEVSLFYYQKRSGTPESVMISSFTPIFIETNKLKPEVSIIIKEFSDKSADHAIGEVYDYLTTFYGAIDKDLVEKWVKAEFDF